MLGKITKQKIIEGLTGLIDDYEDEIGTAYLACDNKLSIPFRLELSPKGSTTKIVASMEFVQEKVKGKIESYADENQKKLPGME